MKFSHFNRPNRWNLSWKKKFCSGSTFLLYKKQDAPFLPHKYVRAAKGRNLRQAWEEQERQGGVGGGT